MASENQKLDFSNVEKQQSERGEISFQRATSKTQNLLESF